MQKRIISQAQPPGPSAEGTWLNLEQLADVEITSEDPDLPIEGALLPSGERGWRAADSGEQTIRLIFKRPHRIRRILLDFMEHDTERTQQFVLRWSADGGDLWREIVRQQWNFSPHGATSEVEDFRVDLADVTTLELTIVPDISGGDARASLARLRLA